LPSAWLRLVSQQLCPPVVKVSSSVQSRARLRIRRGCPLGRVPASARPLFVLPYGLAASCPALMLRLSRPYGQNSYGRLLLRARLFLRWRRVFGQDTDKQLSCQRAACIKSALG